MMYTRREITPSFIIETKTSDKRDGSPVITFTNQPNYRTLPTEMNLRRISQSPPSNDTTNNYEFRTLPHGASADVYIVPESSQASDRNTITLTRRSGSDETHIVAHQPFREPVYKTTMITQVKPRHVDYSFEPQQQQYEQQQPHIQLSVRQSPPSPQQQQQHYTFQQQPQDQSYVIYHHGANRSPPENHQYQQPRLYEQQQQQQYQYEKQQQQDRQQQQYNFQQQQQLPYIYHHTQQQQQTTLPQAAPSRLVYSSQPANQAIARSKPLNQSTSNPTSPQTVIGSDETRKNILALDKQLLSDKKPLQMKLNLGDENDVGGDSNDRREAEVDELTNLLVHNMQMSGDPDFLGMCTKCGRSVMGSANGCTALNQLFHVSCFKCHKCGIGLRNVPFYAAEGHSFCEKCHLMSLEKCNSCAKPIADRLLTAAGKHYHPDCFHCVVCSRSLDNLPFTVDNNGRPHCIEDFQKKYSPKCDGCNGLIVPEVGSERVTRVTLLNKNYHISCYKCQDCKAQLSPVVTNMTTSPTTATATPSNVTSSNEEDDVINNNSNNNNRCYPLDGALLCHGCHVKRINKLANKATTDV